MKVSISMITYNQAKIVTRAVESAVKQVTNFDFEVVIGDDFSTDGTREVLARLQAKYPGKIRLLPTDRHLGMHMNFVRTYLACRGEYLALLEGDDYWTVTDKLQKQVNFLDRHPECSICFTNALMVFADKGGKEREFCKPDQKEISDLDDILAENFIPTCTAVYRHHITDFPSWALNLRIGDWPMNIAYARHGKIGYVPEVTAVFTKHEAGSWTGASAEEKIRNVTEMYAQLNAESGGKDTSLTRALTERWKAQFELEEVRRRLFEANQEKKRALEEARQRRDQLQQRVQQLQDEKEALLREVQQLRENLQRRSGSAPRREKGPNDGREPRPLARSDETNREGNP